MTAELGTLLLLRYLILRTSVGHGTDQTDHRIVLNSIVAFLNGEL
jgi:hypothetical protein